jgi:signal transduction histidine kinase
MAYGGQNLTIEINCYREDEQFYYFSFMDNGVGIPDEHLSRIFELSTGGKRTKPKAGGTVVLHRKNAGFL